MADSLVIEVTVGPEAPERCNQAFTVAAAACAAGVPVDLWLSGEAAWFALPGRAAALDLAESAPLPELLGLIVEAGTVSVCTQSAARRSFGPDDVLPGVVVAGAATYVERLLRPGTQALVY
ncbi:DsrE family protein [Kineosporia succinea]|uniref:Peroxiredoxin n=1 Tax=Kineosporia succinea TaxID=84632 RepID=A0ABT9P2S5_9ACTN|nr:DsrE family protein [Kineosporia succinea]MDP9826990.1 putative peroxiredoxin [Kineosporia succinea]